MNITTKIAFLFLLVTASFPFGSHAQSDKTASLKTMIETQNYTFNAQSAIPLGGRTRQLTSEYTLKVTKDAIISDLPYFGRAYTAPMDPAQNALQFTTKKYNYTITPRKKGGWDILIKPQDNKDIQQLTLTISSAGYATLQVTSVSRSPISFNGDIAH